MKTNYKQSQAAPHAKPIFTVSRNDSTLYVLPAYLAGAVMIRLQHIADGDKVKKLCCKVKNDRLMAMEQDVPQGNVTLTAVDIISPEKCAEKGYRKDGYGYVRTLLVTPTAEHQQDSGNRYRWPCTGWQLGPPGRQDHWLPELCNHCPDLEHPSCC